VPSESLLHHPRGHAAVYGRIVLPEGSRHADCVRGRILLPRGQRGRGALHRRLLLRNAGEHFPLSRRLVLRRAVRVADGVQQRQLLSAVITCPAAVYCWLLLSDAVATA